MSQRFRATNGHLLGLAVLAAAFFYLVEYPLWHTDIWAHAKYGEAYLNHGFFKQEPLSQYTDKDAPFAHVAWLSQVLYFKLYQWGSSFGGDSPASQLHHGAEALRVFHFLLLIARFTLIWLTFRRFGGSSSWAAVCLGLYILAVGIGSAIQRPQAFGLFYMTLLLYALSSPKFSRKWLVILPLMFGLWANMHGTFVVGLAVLGLHTLGRAFERGFTDGEVKKLVLVGALAFLATMVNPHGPMLYWHVANFSKHPNLKTMTEWHPMKFQAGGGSHWPYIMSLVLLGFIWFLGRRKVGAAGWLVAMPFVLWPWWQERSLLWWWAIAMWLLARLGPGLGERFATLPSFPEGEARRWKFVTAMAGLAICVLVLWVKPFEPAVARVYNLSRLSQGTPFAAALTLAAPDQFPGSVQTKLREEIDRQFPDGKFKGVIFASETQGDFLVWALPQDVMPVTLFTHAHVFGKQHWDDCLDAKAGEPNSLDTLKRLDARLLIVETDTHAALCQIIRDSPDWAVVVDEVPPPHPAGEIRHEKFIAVRK